MSDRVSVVTQQGFFENLKGALGGVLVGGLLFLLSFPVLWWNEGRLDISTVVKKAQVVDAARPGTEAEGKLVAVTADLAAAEAVGDPEFLAPGDYVALERNVEMWAWVEHKDEKKKKKVGGGSETTTTYTYEKKWTSRPQDSSEFNEREGHENPRLTIQGERFFSARAKVGAVAFRPSEADLPSLSKLSLRDAAPRPPRGFKQEGDYLFRGVGTMESPHVGDVRVSFEALRGGARVTLFGKLEKGDAAPYLHKGKEKILHVREGDREAAIATLHREYTMITWVLRAIGFFMMWIGLGMFFGPINAVLDILPFLGGVGRFLTFLATLPIAIVLSLVTIAVSIVAHNPVLLAITIVGVIAAVVIVARRRRAAAAAKRG